MHEFLQFDRIRFNDSTYILLESKILLYVNFPSCIE